MFVVVKYGNNETLVCNPDCQVINLLRSIKRRTGFEHKQLIDLSDDTGLVKELDSHMHDSASQYLKPTQTYILVEKQAVSSSQGQFQYVPLLERCQELFPEFQLHQDQPGRKKGARSVAKSPSPAGRKAVSKKKVTPTKQRRNSTIKGPF